MCLHLRRQECLRYRAFTELFFPEYARSARLQRNGLCRNKTGRCYMNAERIHFVIDLAIHEGRLDRKSTRLNSSH